MSRFRRPLSFRLLVSATPFALVVFFTAERGAAQDHAVWGGLEPGPHPVGFTVEYSRDPARIERAERRPDGSPEARPIQRLMQVATWYPARAAQRPMTIGDYIELQESGLIENDRREAGILTAEQRRELTRVWATYGIMTGVDLDAWDRLLTVPMRAQRDAPAAAGPFPVILMLPGASGSVADMMGTAELLASHGYVLVTVPSRGTDFMITRVWSDARLHEEALSDAEYALRATAGAPYADLSRLGVLGFSRGGLTALLFAMRNPSVDAVVGFDPGLGRQLTESPWFEAQRLRVPFLMFVSGARTVPAVLDQLPYAEVRIATMHGLHHVDFGALGMMHTALGVRNQYIAASDERIRERIEWVNVQTVRFFDAHLDADAAAAQRLAEAFGSPPDSVVTSRRAARPTPPASGYLAELAWARGGITQVAELVRGWRARDPEWMPFPEAFLNASAYRFVELARMEEAVEMARLNAELYPTSANVHDTLGEMLALAGQREAAMRAYERALELDPDNDSARASLQRLRSEADGRDER